VPPATQATAAAATPAAATLAAATQWQHETLQELNLLSDL